MDKNLRCHAILLRRPLAGVQQRSYSDLQDSFQGRAKLLRGNSSQGFLMLTELLCFDVCTGVEAKGDKEENPIVFWLLYSTSHKALARLASRLLTATVNAASVEQLFSSSAAIRSARSNRLKADRILEMAQASCFLVSSLPCTFLFFVAWNGMSACTLNTSSPLSHIM